MLFEKIKSGNYDADDPIWENISDDAKNVVAKLLTVRVQHRVRQVSAVQGVGFGQPSGSCFVGQH